MSAKKAFTVLMLMILCLLPFKDTIAAPIVDNSIAQDVSPITEVSTGAAPKPTLNHSGIESLSGSKVTFDPTSGGDSCYAPATPQTLCFKSETYSPDWEYAYNNWIKFPTDWIVSNVYVQGSPVCDSGGSWGSFSWSFQTPPYEINVEHLRFHENNGDHCLTTYCVDVTPAAGANPAEISWYFDGDKYGFAPHNPCSSDGYTPAGQNACDEMVNLPAEISVCSPYVVLTPPLIETSGCHGEAQSHILTIMNMTGAESTFNITYNKDFPGAIRGPSEITLADGESTNFEVSLDPHICTDDADYVATVSVSNGIFSDETTINLRVFSEIHEWQQISANPIMLMDNVLAGYAGKVWSIAGYGTPNGVSTYDPALDVWTIIPDSVPPWGYPSYPRSGCQMGNRVFIYGDSQGTYTGLWSYNMATNTWTSVTPSGTPPPSTGIWAPAWVADTSTGVCYMTGGATAAGGGNLTSVYAYDTIANTWLPGLPAFTSARDFHAAFLYTRPTDAHKLLCVAGGINIDSVAFDSTQCYDFSTASWNAENVDLGLLPNAWWGMGYTQRNGELWVLGGANDSGIYNQSAYYDIEGGEWVVAGPLPSGPVYRTAAVTLGDTVYHVGGSTSGFSPTGLSDKRVDTICPACELPDLIKQATDFALPGQIIHYTITVDPMVKDLAWVTDFLPESVDYVDGSLSVTPDVGLYEYDAANRAIIWSFGSSMGKINGWKPAPKTGIISNASVTIEGGSSEVMAKAETVGFAIDSVLWDQPISSVDPYVYISQEFTDLADYSSFLADDFVVTSPWLIDTIFIPGDGWNGFSTLLNASSLTFLIYEDSGGVPAGDPSVDVPPPVWAQTLPPTDPQITITVGKSGYPSNTLLELDKPILLPTGHYWLIFYPTMPRYDGGQFGRHPSDTTYLNTATYINPGGGFGQGTLWEPWTVIGVTQTDLAFRIEGIVIPRIQIEFDVTASAPNQIIWNTASLQYGSHILTAIDDTFTGFGTYLPMTIK